MLSVFLWLFGLLAGRKTFIVAIAHIVYAIAGVFLGLHDWNTFVALMLNGLGLGALRSGIGSVGR
jgi:hypothetical protein